MIKKYIFYIYIQEFNVLSFFSLIQLTQTHLFRKDEEKNYLFSINSSLHRIYTVFMEKECPIKVITTSSLRYKNSIEKFQRFRIFFFSAEFQVHYATDFYLLDNIISC